MPDVLRLWLDFKDTLQQWKTWNYVTAISNHRVIKDYLWDIFQMGLYVGSL
jgi:hypothetical protein